MSTLHRIAILHYAAPPIIGGVESTIFHHANILSDLGIKVEIIAGRVEPFNNNVEFHRIPEVDTLNSRVQGISKELAQGQISPEFTALRDILVDKLLPILSNCDVCIVHNALSLHFNLALTAALRVINDRNVTQIIAWNHDFAWHDKLYIPDLHHDYPWDLLRSAWPGVRYVVVSEHRRLRLAQLLDIPETDIEVFTPGVDVFKFLNCQSLTIDLVEKLNLLAADPLMLLPARIIPRKNIQFAIRVTAEIKEHMPGATLVVTGPPGPHNPKNISYLESLKDVRSEHGLERNVCFIYEHGEDGKPQFLPDEVVADFFRLADLLIFPSFREGFGIPVLEAGLVQLPVFASNIPPIRESAAEYANLFDPSGDPRDAAECILNYLEVNASYHLKHRVLYNYTWKAIIEQKIIPFISKDEVA
jgi:glycosyltransferase involved in cell wall biosynthesis